MNDSLPITEVYKPHPKQKEFLESEDRFIFFTGAYPTRATGAISKELFEKIKNEYLSK